MTPLSAHQPLHRALAAVLGSFALTNAVAGAMTALVPLPKVEVVFLSAAIAFLVMPAALIWAFLAASPGRAWLGLLAATGVCATIALVFGGLPGSGPGGAP